MMVDMQETDITKPLEKPDRRSLLTKAVALQALTVVWNIAEGAIALIAGIIACSIALSGFGVDSFIETGSAVVVGVRLWAETKGAPTDRIEALERRTSKIAGGLLLALAAYVAVDSVRRLLGVATPAQESALGIAVTVAALIVMPLLARVKLKLAADLSSKSLKADAMETVCCAWLAATTLLGLALNALWHWSWADPVAGLIIVPLLVREGIEALKGEECGCHQSCS